jgi:OPT oligopeptide transporter protein
MNRRPSEEGLLDFNYELGTTASSPSVDHQQEEEVSGLVFVPKDTVSTPRMWTLSLLFAVFGSSLNLLFSLRYPSVTISPIIAILLAHPLGLLWDKAFSDSQESYRRVSSQVIEDDSILNSPTPSHADEQFEQPRIQKASTWQHTKTWLGQGRWNEKEHCCVFIASNVSFGFAFATVRVRKTSG